MKDNIQTIFSELGVYKFLRPVTFEPPKFLNSDKVYSLLDEVTDDDLKTLIIGDYDADGAMCNLVLSDSCEAMDFGNYQIFNYVERTHSLDKHAVKYAIQNHFQCVIIADTGSSDLSMVNRLLAYGLKVIILDHHETMYTYDDFDQPNLAIINTTLENANLGSPVYQYSAGALCYVVMCGYLKHRGYAMPKHVVAYALVSLYADCMNMANELNRAIYYQASSLQVSELPIKIQYFMSNYTVFTRRFIEFWFAPRINSLFRSENFKHLNYVFFKKDPDAAIMTSCLEQIERLYQSSKDLVTKVADIIQIQQMKNFIVADLHSVDNLYNVEENKLYNYTGLIANKLCERFDKPAIVYCEVGDGYRGSFRDLFSRKYLPLFSTFCKAGGHNAAFGFTISKFGFNDFYTGIQRLNDHFALSNVENEPVVLKYETQQPDSKFLEDIARYNDFSGVGTPIILIKKQIVGDMPEVYSQFYRVYKWGSEVKIQSDRALHFGEIVLIKPVRSNYLRLIVQ